MTILKIGDNAPLFTLNNQNSKPISLKDILNQGKKVLLVFYPNDMTPGCTTQLCGIRDVYSEYEKLNVVVLGINHKDEKSHQKFIKMHDYQFDILVDTDKKVATMYGQLGQFFGHDTIKRSVYLIDTNGKVLFMKQGQQDNQVIIAML
jgi:thioredoxin-dependent peroxiredoxin